jgi:hypothetical protein
MPTLDGLVNDKGNPNTCATGVVPQRFKRRGTKQHVLPNLSSPGGSRR